MLNEALDAAVEVGWLILPDVGVEGFVKTDGAVLRYDASGPEDLVARAVWRALTRGESQRTSSAP
jgi:hypothetical protein